MSDTLGFTPDASPASPAPALPPPHDDVGFTPEGGDVGFTPDAQSDGREAEFGTPGQQAITAVEGASQGLLGPVAPYVETKLGLSTPERIKARQEVNPITHGVAEAGTFLGSALTGVGEAALLGKAAEAAASAARLAGITNKYALGAAKAATEFGLFSAGDEATKAVLDPDYAIGNAVANVGTSALMGGVFGGATTGLGALARAGINRIGLKEYGDRLAALAGGLNPAEAMEKEFTDAINTYHAMNDEVLGPQGLKAQALSQHMPEEVSPRMGEQLQSVYDKTGEALKKMQDKAVPERLIRKFQAAVDDFAEVATRPDAKPGEIFDAMNELKRDLQSHAKGNWGPFSVPTHHEAYDFINITKGLGHDVRIALEDPKVWGDVATLQKKLNASWSKALPAVKDAQSKFMEKVGGEYAPSATKFSTYLNTSGKATTRTVRQQMMGNFVKAMEDHFNVVDDLYKAAGIENPHPPVGLGALKESLEKQSLGSKLADYTYNKLTPQVLGAGIGAAAGHALMPGADIVGAYLGRELLGPVLGSITQPLLEKGVNAKAAQHSTAYIAAVLQGEKAVNKAAKSVFVSGVPQVASNMPTDKDLDKLDKRALALKDPSQAVALAGSTGDYLPQHAGAVASTALAAANYINAKRPVSEQTSMFSKPPPVSKGAQAEFRRTLANVQQPMVAFSRIKGGTLTPQDVADIKTVHPAFYQQSSKALHQYIAEQVESGRDVPFKTQQMISLYLGQPISPVLQPASILAAQPQPKPQPQQQAQGKTKRGTAALGKSSKQSMTPGQAAEADSAKRD